VSRRTQRATRRALQGVEADLVKLAVAGVHFRRKGQALPFVLAERGAYLVRCRRLLGARLRGYRLS
jgi:hypothetical protein